MRKKHLIIVAAILTFFGGLFLIWYSLPWKVELTLSGTQEMILEYGREYIEAGAQARASKLFYSTAVAVEQTGTVDTSRLGTYEICYEAFYGKSAAAESRIVHIVDTEPPVIELVGGEDYSILPGTQYKEPGFTAVDNYDGELTQRVSVFRNGGKILYSVTDNSGNRTVVRRTVTERDLEAPQITLTGEAYVEVKLGGYYRELGCTATDDCDGDITHRVEITGEPDTFTPGTYQVCYRVSDLYGNQTEAYRTVCVTPAEGVTVAAYNGKNVYLTFDDGPGPYTSALLDVLGKYDIPATFFVVGSGYDDLLTRMADEGHTVAMHTYCHRYGQIYSSEDAYFADLGRIQEKIESCTGQKPMLLRFPGGSSNTVSSGNKGIMTRLAALMEEQGYTYFDWNVDSRDAGGAASASEVFYNVINGVQRQQNAVVLQHDIKGFSVDAVERIILWGLENGYRFLPLTADSPTCHHTIFN